MQHQNKALPLFNEVQVGDLRPTLKPQNRPICQLCKMELAKKKVLQNGHGEYQIVDECYWRGWPGYLLCRRPHQIGKINISYNIDADTNTSNFAKIKGRLKTKQNNGCKKPCH
jgi:hypothetical protein